MGEMAHMLWVFIGGGLGSMLRLLVSAQLQAAGGGFPLGTLTVNVFGCLAIGALAGFPNTTQNAHGYFTYPYRLFLITGFLGGFTTFSSYAFESFWLFKNGESEKALWNLAMNVILGMIAVLLGFYCMRFVLGTRQG